MHVTTYSYSHFSCYENCPFQYKLKYVNRVTATLGTTIEAFVDSMVHDALEWRGHSVFTLEGNES